MNCGFVSITGLDLLVGCGWSGCQMSKTFIGGAVCREFESEAPAAEEMLD